MEKIREYVNTVLTHDNVLPKILPVELININIEKALDFFKKKSKNAGYYENISLKDNFELLTQQAHLDKDVLTVSEVYVRNEADNYRKFFYNTTNNILTILGHTRHDELNAMVIKYVGDDFITTTQSFKDYCTILCKKDLIFMLETYTCKLPTDVSINIENMKENLNDLEKSFWHNFS